MFAASVIKVFENLGCFPCLPLLSKDTIPSMQKYRDESRLDARGREKAFPPTFLWDVASSRRCEENIYDVNIG